MTKSKHSPGGWKKVEATRNGGALWSLIYSEKLQETTNGLFFHF
jgi:hypothetical protein